MECSCFAVLLLFLQKFCLQPGPKQKLQLLRCRSNTCCTCAALQLCVCPGVANKLVLGKRSCASTALHCSTCGCIYTGTGTCVPAAWVLCGSSIAGSKTVCCLARTATFFFCCHQNKNKVFVFNLLPATQSVPVCVASSCCVAKRSCPARIAQLQLKQLFAIRGWETTSTLHMPLLFAQPCWQQSCTLFATKRALQFILCNISCICNLGKFRCHLARTMASTLSAILQCTNAATINWLLQLVLQLL